MRRSGIVPQHGSRLPLWLNEGIRLYGATILLEALIQPIDRDHTLVERHADGRARPYHVECTGGTQACSKLFVGEFNSIPNLTRPRLPIPSLRVPESSTARAKLWCVG
jgi:hypothetical protein